MYYRHLISILVFNLYCLTPCSETARRYEKAEYSPRGQNPKEGLLSVLPNPTTGVFTIIYRSDSKGNLSLSVCDATGKYVYLKSVKDFSGEQKEQIDLSSLPRGLYVVEAEDDNYRVNRKIILQ